VGPFLVLGRALDGQVRVRALIYYDRARPRVAVDNEREAVRGQHVGAVGELEVQVRLGGVARIGFSQHVTGPLSYINKLPLQRFATGSTYGHHGRMRAYSQYMRGKVRRHSGEG
jgi:hypothetical protein